MICSGCAGDFLNGKLVGDFGISPIIAQDTGGLLWVHGINQLFMAGKGEDVTIGDTKCIEMQQTCMEVDDQWLFDWETFGGLTSPLGSWQL